VVGLRARAAFIIATVTLPSLSSAQRLRGVVRDTASKDPIPGAVVTMLDSAHRALTRAITTNRAPSTSRVPPPRRASA
jgi:hypothetical protein